DGDIQLLCACPGESVFELVDRLGTRERAGRPAGADRGVAGERNLFFDLHPRASRSTGTAWSTSPAPSVTTLSPGRARTARNRTPPPAAARAAEISAGWCA